MTNQPTLGIHYDMHDHEYHAVEACSNSLMTTIASKSPAHIFVDRKDTPALQFGRVLHTAILEPIKFADKTVVAPDVDKRTKDGKAQWADFLATNEGKIILDADSHADAKRMQSQVWVDETARKLLEKGKAEVSLFWEQDGILCKARIDFLSDLGVAVDLKTTKSAKPESFLYDAYNYGYHRQIAWYMRGAAECGLQISNMFIIAIEKTPPFPVSIFDLDEESYQIANAEIDILFATYKRCKESGVYPAYEVNGSNAHTLRLPYKAFSYNQILDKEIDNE